MAMEETMLTLQWSYKTFCILFQQLIAPITEFFPYESVLLEGLNNLSADDETIP